MAATDSHRDAARIEEAREVIRELTPYILGDKEYRGGDPPTARVSPVGPDIEIGDRRLNRIANAFWVKAYWDYHLLYPERLDAKSEEELLVEFPDWVAESAE